MYLSILRELEKLQAELARADPADEAKAAEIVRSMAQSLRRLELREPLRAPAPTSPVATRIVRRA